MFAFEGSPVPVRDDLTAAYRGLWGHFAAPGPTLTGPERVRFASYVRAVHTGDTPAWIDMPESVLALATMLYTEPRLVGRSTVSAAARDAGYPVVVEVIALVSMLAAVDGAHRALGARLEPLPVPEPGEPTKVIADGLKQRGTNIPMAPGSILSALDLLPDVGRAFRTSSGPQYMTEQDMALPRFERTPGLNRAQIEIVASRTSLLNECFY